MSDRGPETSCQNVERLITEKTERQLRENEAANVRLHLQTCASCRAFLHTHDEVLDLFINDYAPAPESLISADFTDRIMARLARGQGQAAPLVSETPVSETPSEKPEEVRERIPERLVPTVPEGPAIPATPEIAVPPSPPVPLPRKAPALDPHDHPAFKFPQTGQKKPAIEVVRARKTTATLLRPLFRPAMLMAASVLIALVLTWLFLSDSSRSQLDTWNNTVVWRDAGGRNWHPVKNRVSLGLGDAVYTAPEAQARFVLADGTTLDLPGDSYVEQATTGPWIPGGNAYFRTAGQGSVVVETPFASVELEKNGEFFLGVNRPDAKMDGPGSSTSDPKEAGDDVGEVIVWVLQGTAHVTPRGTPTQTDRLSVLSVRAGQARAFLPGGHAYELPGYELDTLGHILEPLQQPSPGRPSSARKNGPFRSDLPLSASLTEALRQNDPAGRLLAVHISGRLGLRSVVDRAVSMARMREATPTFKCAVVKALTRTRGEATSGNLLALLADPSPRVQAAVTRSLEQIPLNEAHDRLTTLVQKSHDARVRHGAARALARLATPVRPGKQAELATAREHEEMSQTLDALKGSVLLELPEAIAGVGRYLTDRRLSDYVRAQAASLLTNVQDPGVEPWFIPALTDPDATVRTLALKVIGEPQRYASGLDPEVVRGIRKTANRDGTHPLERLAAVQALVNRGLFARHELIRLITAAGAPDSVRLAALKGWCCGHEPASEYERLFNAVNVETEPSIPVLTALVQHYADDVKQPERVWLTKRLDDRRPEMIRAAARALDTLHDRVTGSFVPGDAVLLQQRLASITDPAARLSLIHLITKLLPTEESRLHFLGNVLQGATAAETCSVIGILKTRKSAQAASLLLPLLRHEDPQVLTSAVQALGSLGAVAGAAVPELIHLHEARLQRDPRLQERETFSLVKTLFRMGEVRTALPALTGLIERGEQWAEDAVREIHAQLGSSAATAMLINYHDHPRATVRLAIAREFVQGVPEVHLNKIHTWWKAETDPWTRFALAFVLVERDRQPAVEALHWMRREVAPTQRANLARSVGMNGFEAFAAAMANPDRNLPTGWRKGLQDFLFCRPWATSIRLENRTTATGENHELSSLRAYGNHWIDRVRVVRWGLHSTHAAARRTAALDARSILDRTLVPILIDKLLDPDDIDVRRAAAETLSGVSRSALTHYDPEARGDVLRRQVAQVRKAFRALDLEALLPSPLPLVLSRR